MSQILDAEEAADPADQTDQTNILEMMDQANPDPAHALAMDGGASTDK